MNKKIYYGTLLMGLGISILGGSVIGFEHSTGAFVWMIGQSIIAGCIGYHIGWCRRGYKNKDKE